jgi:uncharacterized membrane protein YfcA
MWRLTPAEITILASAICLLGGAFAAADNKFLSDVRGGAFAAADNKIRSDPAIIHMRLPYGTNSVFMEMGKEAEHGNKPDEFGWRQALGIVFVCFGLMLAAGGGIGGGGILVPILIIVMGFSARYGVPLSNITILGGAVANNAFNVHKRHPVSTVRRPMVDYDLVLLMEPPTIAGAVFGTILNKVLPEYIITILLVLVLGATTVKTCNTGRKLWAKEQKELQESGTDHEAETWGQFCSNLFSFDYEEEEVSQPLVSSETKEELPDASPEIRAMLEDDARTLPWWKIGAISLCFILVVITNILKLEFCECGTAGYWLLLMAPVIITVGMSFMIRSYLLNKGELKRSNRVPLVEGDVDWDSTTTITYPLLCTLAGLFAGMFGIGGGIVKGPLMLEMGVLPEVSAATAAFMILFTAASATVSYAAFDQVDWTYALILFPIGLVCTAVGQCMINSYIKRTNHRSAIVFIIAAIVGLSTVLMGYESTMIAIRDIEDNKTVRGLCT